MSLTDPADLSTGLPAGVTARRPRLDDAPALHALVVAVEESTGGSDATLAEVEANLADPAYDREGLGLVVADGGGSLVGWLWSGDDPAKDELFLDPYALDAAVLAWLLARGLDGAAGLAAERPGLVARAGSYQHDVVLSGVLEGAGFVVVRSFWRMRLELDATSPVTPPQLPAGVTIRRALDVDADLHLMHELHQESFRDHFASVYRSYDDWLERLASDAGRDPAQWWVASVDGEPVGVLIGDDAESDNGVSVVRTLGVLAPGRGRGVAKALLRTAFAEAAARRRSAVALFVDSESLTGATRVYESVGMQVDKVLLAWRRPLA